MALAPNCRKGYPYIIMRTWNVSLAKVKTTRCSLLCRIISPAVLLALSLMTGAAHAQEEKGTSAIAPAAPNFLEQFEAALTGLVREAQSAVVSIEVRLPAVKVLPRQVFPPATPDRPPLEKRAEHEKEWKMAEEAFKDAARNLSITFGHPRTGSGFLIPGGFVVTTHEVVSGMKEQPVVTLSDGRRLKAEWTNTDKNANIAVMKLPVAPEMGLKWARSENIAAGNLAITIGNQAGFANSASMGLIAGVNRAGASNGIRYDNLIQFQGVVGIGGSGSPLLDSRGEVIGMVMATPAGAAMQRAEALPAEKVVASRKVNKFRPSKRIASREEVAENEIDPDALPEPQANPMEPAAANVFVFGGLANTGFAIPAHTLRPIAELLSKGPTVKPPQPGWMGLLPVDSTGANRGKGVLLSRIYIGMPADHAGLQPGDLVTAINGKPVRSKEDMKQALQNILAGQAIRLEVKRGTMTLTRTLITEPKPDEDTIRNDEIPYHEIP